MIAWQHFTKTLHVGRKSCLRNVAAWAEHIATWAEQPQGTAQSLYKQLYGIFFIFLYILYILYFEYQPHPDSDQTAYVDAWYHTVKLLVQSSWW